MQKSIKIHRNSPKKIFFVDINIVCSYTNLRLRNIEVRGLNKKRGLDNYEEYV